RSFDQQLGVLACERELEPRRVAVLLERGSSPLGLRCERRCRQHFEDLVARDSELFPECDRFSERGDDREQRRVRDELRSGTGAGPTVDVSMSTEPDRRPASTPPSPSATARNAAGSVTMVMTNSPERAASAGVAATLAPASVSGSARLLVRFHTVSSWPESR